MDWRKNLYQYEEQPPVHAWDMIAKELDSDIPEFRSRLADLELQPPDGAWETISAEIEEKAPVRYLAPWYKKPWNIAAAAASLVLLFGTIYFRGPKTAISPSEISTSVFKPAPRPENNPVESIPAVPRPVLDADITPGIAQANISQTQQNVMPKPGKKTRRAKDSNYIYFTLAGGDERRLSYKLEELLPAIRNRGKNDMLDHWSAALESSAFVPSGNNFFDIVEMVKMVEERQ